MGGHLQRLFQAAFALLHLLQLLVSVNAAAPMYEAVHLEDRCAREQEEEHVAGRSGVRMRSSNAVVPALRFRVLGELCAADEKDARKFEITRV